MDAPYHMNFQLATTLVMSARYTIVVQFFVFKEFLVLVILTLLTVFVGFFWVQISA